MSVRRCRQQTQTTRILFHWLGVQRCKVFVRTSASVASKSSEHGQLSLPDVSQRFFGARRKRPKEPLRQHAGTIVCHNASAVTAEQILMKISSNEEHFTATSVILLLTPRLAQFYNQDFIQAVLNRLCQTSLHADDVQDTIRVVTAIVDKVPCLQGRPPAEYGASEGVSYLLSNNFMYQKSSKTLMPADNSEALASTKDVLPVLRFSSTQGKLSHRHIQPYRATVAQIHVPVANTLFVTGKPSSLLQSFWLRGEAGPERHWRPLTVPDSLQNFTIDIKVAPEEFFSLHNPLTPITPVRGVKEMLGNVLREIEIEGKTVPASTELERAVTDKVKALGLQANDKVLVYALIKTETSSFTRKTNRVKLDSFGEDLELGAQLFRVTGGGGGWGSKQGLLSLDMDDGLAPGLAQKENRNTHHALDDEDFSIAGVLGSTGLSEEGGKTVQFYMSTVRGGGQGLGPSRPDANYVGDEPRKEVVVGAIAPQQSSSADRQNQVEEGGETGVELLRGVFGVFSERGIALVANKVNDRGRRSVFLGTLDHAIVSSTKLDVPGLTIQLPER